MTSALILAAGQGTRLRPLTDNCPKCMVQYQSRPLIEHILSAMRACQVHEISLVTGYKSEALEYLCLKSFQNPFFSSTNMVHSMFCAEEALEGDVIISYSDIIFSSEILSALLQSKDDFAVVVDTRWRELWEIRMEDPLLDAETMKIDTQGYIQELGRKPQSLQEIEGQYIGLFKISAEAIRKVRTFYHGLDRQIQYDGRSIEQMYMTTFIQLVIDRLMPVKAVRVAGGWLEIDTPTDLQCLPIR